MVSGGSSLFLNVFLGSQLTMISLCSMRGRSGVFVYKELTKSDFASSSMMV